MNLPTVSRRPECPRCLRAQTACVCGFAARVVSEVEVLILQHPMEVREAKGTARLLHLSLDRSALVVGETFDEIELHGRLYGGGRQPVLLYPRFAGDTAAAFDPDVSCGAPVRLVILDGTWRKSVRMLASNPLLRSLPRLALDQAPPSAYHIRKARHPHQLSTLEAAACALARLDSAANLEPLLAGFSAFVRRQAAFAAR